MLGVAAITLLVWAGLLPVVAHVKFGGDLRGFLFLGEEIYHPDALAGIPRCGRYGYDGQFYAALATDPLLRSPETVRALDAPAYRASRILLPMIAWCAALGNPRAAVVAYQALSWSLSVLAVVVVSLWLRQERRSPWWGLLLVINAGLVTAIFRSTHDGAAVVLIVATLWLAGGQRHGWALATASAAILCRETGYAAALAVAVHELVKKRYRRALQYVLVPLVPQLAWQAYLQTTWHPNFGVPASVAFPVVALAGKMAAILGAHPVLLSQEFWGTLAACLTVLGGLVVVFGKRRFEPERLAFIAFAVLAVCLAPRAYADVYGFSRHLIAAPFLAVVIAAGEKSRWVRAVLLSAPAAFSIAGLLMIAGELEPLIGSL